MSFVNRQGAKHTVLVSLHILTMVLTSEDDRLGEWYEQFHFYLA